VFSQKVIRFSYRISILIELNNFITPKTTRIHSRYNCL